MLRRPNYERGQSLVEMAVGFVVLLMIVLGVLDLGRLFYTFLALQDAAGEGAGFGAAHPGWISAADSPDPDNVHFRARNESGVGLVEWSQVRVEVASPNYAEGEPITVTLTYDYRLWTPLISAIVGDDSLPLRAMAVQTILGSSR